MEISAKFVRGKKLPLEMPKNTKKISRVLRGVILCTFCPKTVRRNELEQSTRTDIANEEDILAGMKVDDFGDYHDNNYTFWREHLEKKIVATHDLLKHGLNWTNDKVSSSKGSSHEDLPIET